MARPTDIRPLGVEGYLLPVRTRVPLKFGPETLTEVLCLRVRMRVERRDGTRADGWGETPLSVPWTWPSPLTFAERQDAIVAFCRRIAADLRPMLGDGFAHPLALGHRILDDVLPALHRRFNATDRNGREPLPRLAALVALSAFDLAMHDAFGVANAVPTYRAYGPEYLEDDLSAFLGEPERFAGHYPAEFFRLPTPSSLPAWHLVGGKDPLDPSELTGDEPDDGYPVLLRDWIARDGLTSLKVKLRGDDATWDFARMVRVGEIAEETGVTYLSADFNCTVKDTIYVEEILDRLRTERKETFDRILYVEQPFPYDLEANPIDVHALAARKPLFLDESAHDWRVVRFGESLGWTGVALKTCKTQTGALLSLCWARAHGMALMVQDLTNPMLAQIPHVLLAAHAGTIRGVETNAMQFYPEASRPEEAAHPGLYRRRAGRVDLATIAGPGFGYRLDRIHRELPAAAFREGEIV